MFAGNPAAVVILDTFLPIKTMQALALENNLSETAFVVARKDGDYDLRWFTPLHEVDFCGHATIASAHVMLSELGAHSPITFRTKIGPLHVSLTQDGYEMQVPAFEMEQIELTAHFLYAFNQLPNAAWQSCKNIFLMFPNAKSVAEFKPDFSVISALSSQKGVDDGLIIMARGDSDIDAAYARYDFVSRYFVPAFGIDEDPVTGSNHASLAPFWGARLDKQEMLAYQASARGGALKLRLEKNSVFITGQAVTYMHGAFRLYKA
ncbi:MAG: PhzF family phenazine biosynthesis protein [Robiginitomaculum sp.]|nr:PhzF family phenazine biosynthesis protein [Robiginitomaculum sp.]